MPVRGRGVGPLGSMRTTTLWSAYQIASGRSLIAALVLWLAFPAGRKRPSKSSAEKALTGPCLGGGPIEVGGQLTGAQRSARGELADAGEGGVVGGPHRRPEW